MLIKKVWVFYAPSSGGLGLMQGRSPIQINDPDPRQLEVPIIGLTTSGFVSLQGLTKPEVFSKSEYIASEP